MYLYKQFGHTHYLGHYLRSNLFHTRIILDNFWDDLGNDRRFLASLHGIGILNVYTEYEQRVGTPKILDCIGTVLVLSKLKK